MFINVTFGVWPTLRGGNTSDTADLTVGAACAAGGGSGAAAVGGGGGGSGAAAVGGGGGASWSMVGGTPSG